jgi:hypothetical protein
VPLCHQISDAVAESYVVALKLCYTAIECALPSPSCAALCILAGRSAGGPCAIVASWCGSMMPSHLPRMLSCDAVRRLGTRRLLGVATLRFRAMATAFLWLWRQRAVPAGQPGRRGAAAAAAELAFVGP